MSNVVHAKISDKKILIGSLCFLITIGVMAQETLKGIIINSSDNSPLPYVNIGVIDKSIGTVTNEKGNFNLFINNGNYKDSIRISMVGFISKTFSTRDFIKVLKESPTIKMNEKVEELSEVVITNRKLKTKVLGSRCKSRKNFYQASAKLLGSEVGVKIRIKKSPTLLKKFNTRVLTKEHSKFKFRLNIYDIQNGLPNKNLLKENIVVDSNNINDGFMNVNLEPYGIYVTDDFFVTLEWIKGDGRRKLRFPATLLGPTVVERETSQAKWNKHTIASIGFNVTVEY